LNHGSRAIKIFITWFIQTASEEPRLKIIELTGKSSYARGLVLGKMIKDICIHNLQFLRQKLVDNALSLNYGVKLSLENEKVIAKHFPELLAEIKGLADGAQLPYNYILLETAFPFTAGASSNCTIASAFGSATTDGVPLVGRNYDFLLNFERCNQLRLVTNKKFSFVAGTVTILGIEEGLNSAGLFIGDAGWEPKELPSSRGLSSRQVMQLVLENCASVDAAIDFIHQIPKFANSAGTGYLLADQKEAAIIEMGLTKSCLRRSKDDILVASNVFVTPIAEEMKPPEPTAVARYDFAIKCLFEGRGKVDNEFMRKLLSDHNIPICSHKEISTLRSVILKTNERKMLVAEGHPCSSEFEEVLIPHGF
jgi:hypothetical protein